MKNIFKKIINSIVFIFLIIPALLPYVIFIFRKILFVFKEIAIFIKAPKIFSGKTHGTGGGWQPAYYYYKYKVDSLETKDNLTLVVHGEKYFYFKMFFALFGRKNILNGGCPGTSLIYLLFAYLKKNTLIYTHSGEWGYELGEKTNSKLKNFLVEKIHQNNFILCISKVQEDYLKDKFSKAPLNATCGRGQNIQTSIIYNTAGATSLEIKQNKDELNIIMIGTPQKRQGVDLYSKLADFAKDNKQKWNFYWMSSSKHWTSENNYFSKNVTWLKHNNDVNAVLKQVDIFFLSAIDNPFSLATLEALNQYKKVVAYRGTGSAEVIENISGCAIYEKHDVNQAYDALQKVIQEPLDIQKVKNVNHNISSVESLSDRLDSILKEKWGS